MSHAIRPRRAFRLNPLAFALSLLPGALAAQPMLPSGLTVVRGQGNAVTAGNNMTVTNSNGAILHWRQFSIGAQQGVQFVQPTAASQVLNRVTGGDPSQILGALSSNGKVWLLNPNGVLFGQGARVNVAGLVASSLALSDADWIAGRSHFRRDPGLDSDGRVVNHGELRTVTGGEVMLLGSSVSNEGLIEAPGGQVVLAAGKSIDLLDTHLPSFAVRVTAPDGAAVNIGQVLAPAGRIDLTAAMVNQRGVLRADAIGSGPGGEVRLQAVDLVGPPSGSTSNPAGRPIVALSHSDDGRGTTVVSGDISARSSSDRGGVVTLLGRHVSVEDGGVVDASGASGGGDIFIGRGAQRGDPSAPHAESASIARTARLHADATGSGDGGRVLVWSDADTRAQGQFSARGGPKSGNGGVVETSGGGLDASPALVSTIAPSGRAGLWRLESHDIVIADRPLALAITDDSSLAAAVGSTTIESAAIARALDAGNNVAIEATNAGAGTGSGAIRMLGSSVVAKTTAPVSLTLQASGRISISEGSALGTTDVLRLQSGPSGSIDLDRATLRAGRTDASGISQGGQMELASGTGITASASTLSAGADLTLTASNATAVIDIRNNSNLRARGALSMRSGTRNVIGATDSALESGADMNLSSGALAFTRASIQSVGGDVTLAATGAAAPAAGPSLAHVRLNASPVEAAGNVALRSGAFGEVVVNDAVVAGGRITVSTDHLRLEPGARLLARATGDAIVAAGTTPSGSANLQTLANAAGRDALQTPNGRWLLYATDPTRNFDAGGLAHAATLYGTRYPSTGIPAIGTQNLLLFSVAPTLSLSSAGAPVTITKTYDGNTTVLATHVGPLAGEINGDRVVGTVGRFGDKNAGTGKPLELFPDDLPIEAVDRQGKPVHGYASQQGPTTVAGNITPATVTLQGNAVFADKPYDRSTAAELASVGLSGVLPGEQVVVSRSGFAFDTKDAGAGKPVTGTATLEDGVNGLASNYRIDDPRLSGTASILRRSLTSPTPQVADKTYDSTDAATVTSVSLNGVLAPDQVSAPVRSATFDTPNAGQNKPVTVVFEELAGADGHNYVLGTPSVVTAASIGKKDVGSPVVQVADKTYDRTDLATVTSVTVDGVFPSDRVTAPVRSATFDTPSAGQGKTVTVVFGEPTGPGAGNYALASPAVTTTANIDRKGVAPLAPGVADKTYDGSNAALVTSLSLDGVLPPDQVTPVIGGATFDTPSAGASKSVTVALAGLDGPDRDNYALTATSVTTAASIAPATLTYVATPAVMFAGGTLPRLDGSVTGFVGGDTEIAATSGARTFTSPATPTSTPGLYAVVGSGLTAANYAFVQAPANDTALRVEPALQAPVQDVAIALTRTPETMRMPLRFTSPSSGRVLDALAAVQPGSSALAFQEVPVGSMSQEALEAMLAARERLKRELFAQSIQRLEQDPALADVPPCQTLEQIETGRCLMAPALNVARALPGPTADGSAARPVAGAGSPQGRAATDADRLPSQTMPDAGPPSATRPAPAAPGVTPPVGTAPAGSSPTPATESSTPAAPSLARPAPLFPRRAIRSAALPQIERKLAVLIGNDHYADSRIPQLDNAVADVRAVAATLERELGYETVVIENAGKARMVAALNKLAAEASATDSVVIYYAGHGQLVPGTGLGYWQPADADADTPETWISNRDIGKLVEQIGASQVALISDSCYSGSLVAEERIRATTAALDPAQVLKTKAAVVMSSGGSEPVFDSGKDGHSVFSWNLMRTLQQVPTWQAGGNVFERVRFAVARELPQRPRYGAAPQWGHQAGSDYLFEKRELGEAR